MSKKFEFFRFSFLCGFCATACLGVSSLCGKDFCQCTRTKKHEYDESEKFISLSFVRKGVFKMRF